MLVEWLDRVPEAAPADFLLVQVEVVDEERRCLHARASGAAHAALLKAWARAAS